jgi:hypothetical protein
VESPYIYTFRVAAQPPEDEYEEEYENNDIVFNNEG